MTNKIPQEIEENRKMCSNWYEEGYNDGFKAGQKQSEDAFKEMIEEDLIFLENMSFLIKSNNLSLPELRLNDLIIKKKELLSKIGDVQQSKEKRE